MNTPNTTKKLITSKNMHKHLADYLFEKYDRFTGKVGLQAQKVDHSDF